MGIRQAKQILNYDFNKCLRKYLKRFHKVIPLLPLRGEYTEQVLVNIFEELRKKKDIGLEYDWQPGSHRKGTDIVLCGTTVSVKSGKIKNRPALGCDVLKYSSYRTTSYKTLDEKVEFLTKMKAIVNLYLFISSVPVKDGFEYRVFSWNGKQLGYDNLALCGDKNYRSEDKGVDIMITSATSDQEWVQVPVAYLTQHDAFRLKIGKQIRITDID